MQGVLVNGKVVHGAKPGAVDKAAGPCLKFEGVDWSIDHQLREAEADVMP